MKIAILLLALAFFSTNAFSQAYQWKTAVLVDNPDSKVAAATTKALETELKALKNVTITKDDAELRVIVLMNRVQMQPFQGPQITSYATSLIIANKSQCGEGWILISASANFIDSDKLAALAKHVTEQVKERLDRGDPRDRQ